MDTSDNLVSGNPMNGHLSSETDEDFDTMPYVLKIPANDSVIDIDQLISFYHSEQWSPQAIRKSIENKLSWEKQMDIILHTI